MQKLFQALTIILVKHELFITYVFPVVEMGGHVSSPEVESSLQRGQPVVHVSWNGAVQRSLRNVLLSSTSSSHSQYLVAHLLLHKGLGLHSMT